MLVEHPPHCELPGCRELDQLAVAVEKHLAGFRAQFRPKQKAIDAECLLRIGKRAAQRFHRHAVLGAE